MELESGGESHLLFLLIFVAEQFAPQPNPHVAISELDLNEHSAMASAANLTEERSGAI